MGSQFLIMDSNQARQSVESCLGGSWFPPFNVVGTIGQDFPKTHGHDTRLHCNRVSKSVEDFHGIVVRRMPSVMEGIHQTKLKCPSRYVS